MIILTPYNGSLYYTTDKNLAISEAFKPDSKVMFIDDIEREFFQKYNNPNMVNAALLLPPYSAMCAYQEGNDQQFARLYEQHILTMCSKVISAIIRSLCNGCHIMFYIPDFVLTQVEYFLSYLNNYHGLLCGNDHNVYTYNPAFQDNNIRYMYFMNHVSAEEVVANIDLNCLRVDVELTDRLMHDINPYIPLYNIDSIINTFSVYKEQMIKVDRPLQPMIRAVIKEDSNILEGIL